MPKYQIPGNSDDPLRIEINDPFGQKPKTTG